MKRYYEYAQKTICFDFPEELNVVSLKQHLSQIKLIDEPQNVNIHMNVLRGKVDELIYSGFQTRYFVETTPNITFKVFKQHIQYFMNDSVINWKDEVYITWDADDGYIVEVE